MSAKTPESYGPGARFAFFLTAFISGFSILALELLAFRLFAPRFGYSTYVSASIVGSVLFVLSIGYVLGGSIADRSPRPGVMYAIILCAGIYMFPMLFLYKQVIDHAFLKFGTITGSIFAALAIYAVPMILLSTVSPFVIKLLALERNVGRTAGMVFFVSTIGSLLGTFLTPLVLIYFFGSHLTLIILSSTVLLLGVLGMLPFNFRAAVALVLFGLIPISFPKPDKNVVYEKDSFYNNLRVIKHANGQFSLSVNFGTWYSVSVSDNYLTTTAEEIDRGGDYHYYDYFAVVPMLAEGKDILILGMGAGTSVRQFEHFYPDARIDAVEIDPEIIRIAREKWFDVRETKRIKIYPLDARPFLSTTDKKYDVIELDMFQGGPNIPFYVTTVEFYRSISDHLNPGGVVTMNVLQLGDDKRLKGSVGKTLLEVFPTVYACQHRGNVILLAFKEDLELVEVNARLKREAEKYPVLKPVAANFGLSEFTGYPGSQVFTDDKANIEILTFSMVEKTLRERRKKEKE